MSAYPYKFRILYDQCYARFGEVLYKFMGMEYRVLDLGSGDGFVARLLDTFGRRVSVTCVDINRKALSGLFKKKFRNTQIVRRAADINQFIAQTRSQFDLIVCHATLHEINIPDNQGVYLDLFLKRLHRILNSDGLVVIADYYYPSKVSNQQVEKFLQYQMEKIGHADPREMFISPYVVRKVVLESKLFQVIYSHEMRAIKEIDRRYYILVLKKLP